MSRFILLSLLLSTAAFAGKHPAVSGKILNHTKISCWDMGVSISVSCLQDRIYTFGGGASTDVDGKDCSFEVPAFSYKCGMFEDAVFTATVSAGKTEYGTFIHALPILSNGTDEQVERLPVRMEKMTITADPSGNPTLEM